MTVPHVPGNRVVYSASNALAAIGQAIGEGRGK